MKPGPPGRWAAGAGTVSRSGGRLAQERPRARPPVRAAPLGAALLQHHLPPCPGGHGLQLWPLTAPEPLITGGQRRAPSLHGRGRTSPSARLAQLHGYRPLGRNLGLCSCAPGHGSHGRTMYPPPAGRAPQPGGLYQFLVKNNKPPGWWSSRKVWNPLGFCKSGRGADGRVPVFTIFTLQVVTPACCSTSTDSLPWADGLVNGKDSQCLPAAYVCALLFPDMGNPPSCSPPALCLGQGVFFRLVGTVHL